MPARAVILFGGASIVLAVALAAYVSFRPGDVPFMPHGMCYLWSPGLIWANVVADSVTAASYIAIAGLLTYFVGANREKVPFHWMVIAFGTFILACGATHVMDIVTLWLPEYWLSTGAKLVTATASAVTAVSLVIVLPHVTATIVRARLADASSSENVVQRDRAIGESSLKSQFVATMSHELRTPLAAIVGTAELLGLTALDERQRKYAHTIDAAAEALLAVIGSVLDFSKIEAGKIDLETSVFRLETLVAAVAGVLSHQGQRSGMTFHTYVDPQIPSVLRGDAGRLRQIILNLAGNALKFTAAGHVVVRATLVKMTARDATVWFEVEDTGAGIAAEVIPQLFNPFVQGAASEAERLGGTGLGLSISKRLVELMHGEIGVSSEVGVGSRFWFTARFGRSSIKGIKRRIVGARALLVSQDDLFLEIVARYADAWRLPNRSLKTVAAAISALDAASNGPDVAWIVIADADTVDASLIGAAIDRIRWGRARVLRVGRDEALSIPVSPALLFDGILTALRDGADLPAGWDGVDRRVG